MKDWYFSRNPFLTATEGSFISALDMSIFHDRVLSANKADPSILAMFNVYHPLHVAYQACFDQWKTQGGWQQGDTLDVNQLLRLLSGSKIENWDIKIRSVYVLNSPQYIRLLPNRRKPFQRGSLTERINSVKALSSAIGSDEALVAVKNDIDTFYVQLDAARNEQKESLSSTKTLSNTLEAARVAMCTGQFVNLGALIQKYPSSPEIIDTFFDLETIRNGKQLLYKGNLNPNVSETILKHTFGVNDQILLTNLGNTVLKFYLASTSEMLPGTTYIEMSKGEQTVLASELGSLENTYLRVVNTNTNFAGAYSIVLI